MGVYSGARSARFEARVCADLRTIVTFLDQHEISQSIRAVVLIGEYGRGEGTPCTKNGEEIPYDDYEFAIVLKACDMRHGAMERRVLEYLAKRLTRAVGVPVIFDIYAMHQWKKAGFTMRHFTMRYGYQVLWGDKSIMDAMPRYPKESFPFSAGTRQMVYQGCLLLDAVRRFRSHRKLNEKEHFKFSKHIMQTYLTIGDCALLLGVSYHMQLDVKRRRIERFRTFMPEGEIIVDRVLQCMELKKGISYDFIRQGDVAGELKHLIPLFVRFYQWYESQRLDVDATDLDQYIAALRSEGSETGHLSALLKNVMIFRSDIWNKNAFGLTDHPRLRLYAAMPLLLAKTQEKDQLSSVLNTRSHRLGEAEDLFYRMHRRYI